MRRFKRNFAPVSSFAAPAPVPVPYFPTIQQSGVALAIRRLYD
jgi:hypothetical protein